MAATADYSGVMPFTVDRDFVFEFRSGREVICAIRLTTVIVEHRLTRKRGAVLELDSKLVFLIIVICLMPLDLITLADADVLFVHAVRYVHVYVFFLTIGLVPATNSFRILGYSGRLLLAADNENANH
jgi:hypothetical protein